MGSRRDAPRRALNEAVVEKHDSGHTVRLGVEIDGEAFTSYAADGLIVATPTGSTAYSLSARGPVVSPTHRAMLLTPVSPHMLFDRALVLDPDEEIVIEVLGHRLVDLTLDDQGRWARESWRSGAIPSGRGERSLRPVRSAPVPPDPEEQVRIERPLMLTELQISNLGSSSAELDAPVPASGVHQETGAGKTMLLSAIELLVRLAESFVVRPEAMRPGSRGGSSWATASVVARVVQ
ncbi:MAG: hypothetical protein R2715_09905 [Ilumatobacteraceae bacterium]